MYKCGKCGSSMTNLESLISSTCSACWHQDNLKQKREAEANEATEVVVKADRLEIDGVDMSKTWVDAHIKGMAGAGAVHPKEDVLKKHNHYFKDVSNYKEIDVYALCKIFEIDDPSGCTQHAIKKLLAAGKRGHKDRLRDLQDVVDTVKRLIELEAGNE